MRYSRSWRALRTGVLSPIVPAGLGRPVDSGFGFRDTDVTEATRDGVSHGGRRSSAEGTAVRRGLAVAAGRKNLAQLESDLIDVAAGRVDLHLRAGDPAAAAARAARHGLKVSPLSQDLHACHLTAGGGEGRRGVGGAVGRGRTGLWG
jgi:hypothetical protein